VMITDCIMSFNKCTTLTAPIMLKRGCECAGVADVADVADVAGVAAGVAAMRSGRTGSAFTMVDTNTMRCPDVCVSRPSAVDQAARRVDGGGCAAPRGRVSRGRGAGSDALSGGATRPTHAEGRDGTSFLGETSDWTSGQGGIRTHGTLAGTPVFKTGSFNHSDTCPGVGVPRQRLRRVRKIASVRPERYGSRPPITA
jgi:hypothetical protein